MLLIKLAIIDADLIGRSKHRFPNLVCMKLSSYYKSLGWEVKLKIDYENLEEYDKVTISKVFMDTEIPYEPEDKSMKTEKHIAEFYKNNPILNLPNVQYGGTGFYYDKSPKLEEDIEHIMPDYHLYDEWVNQQIDKGVSKKEMYWYTDYSIGFTTRGCIRHCSFCVNKNYNKCFLHSCLSEFLDTSRPKICLLDDNVLACKDWKQVFDNLNATGKKFQFKQGIDERLLTDEKCEIIFNRSNYDGDITFAFDNIKDKDLIIDRLKMIRRHSDKQIRFYLFCAFNHDNPDHYDETFYRKDITDLFERIKILMEYGCLPYIMRYKDYEISPYRGIYITVARWCNQPTYFKKKSIREFAQLSQATVKRKCADVRYLEQIEKDFPEIAKTYFDMKWNYSNKNK